MAGAVTELTDTTNYPVFESKAEFMAELENEKHNIDRIMQALYQLSNTDTSTWADPTVRHDA